MLEGAIGEFQLVSALKIISQADTISDSSNFYFIQVLSVIIFFFKEPFVFKYSKSESLNFGRILLVSHHVLNAHDMLLM